MQVRKYCSFEWRYDSTALNLELGDRAGAARSLGQWERAAKTQEMPELAVFLSLARQLVEGAQPER
jgi:hypothetical protein